jgi:hypothetical protein
MGVRVRVGVRFRLRVRVVVRVNVRAVVGSCHVFAWNASRLRAKEGDEWETRTGEGEEAGSLDGVG